MTENGPSLETAGRPVVAGLAPGAVQDASPVSGLQYGPSTSPVPPKLAPENAEPAPTPLPPRGKTAAILNPNRHRFVFCRQIGPDVRLNAFFGQQ